MASGNGGVYLRTAGESPVRQWWGIYYGYIAVNQDPLNTGRVKLRVPQIFGNTTSGWASPMVPVTYIPKVGTAVTVMFVGGDPTQPVWFGNFAVAGSGMVLTGITTPSDTPSPVPPVGTIYYQLDSNNNIQGQYEWNGAGWVEYFIGGNFITGDSINSALLSGAGLSAGTIGLGALDNLTASGMTLYEGTVAAADVIVSGPSGGLFIYGTGGTLVQTFSNVGTFTWKCPPGVTTVYVECWGAGGGGGRGNEPSDDGGTGGGGGEYGANAAYTVVPGSTYTFVIGSGGFGGHTGSSSGGPGGFTLFDTTGVGVQANGGNGGAPGGTGGGAGTGGTGGGAPIAFPGGKGNPYTFPAQHGMGGGASGGPDGPGQGNNTDSRSGNPGGPDAGPGGDGGSSVGPTAGSKPPAPGGGGGGGGTSGNSAADGGAGAHGQIRLTYTASAANLTGSITGQAGVDPVSGAAVPEGAKFDNLTVGTQLTATGGTITNPTVVTTDTWHETGGLESGWGKGSGFFKYTLLPNNMVAVCAQGLTIGTVADTTPILSAANGLPPAYQPTTPKSLVADTNNIKAGSATYENARLTFNTDGSVIISGFNLNATYCNLNGIFPLGF
jgi:hypothetical protein